jgi:hypothetical protein
MKFKGTSDEFTCIINKTGMFGHWQDGFDGSQTFHPFAGSATTLWPDGTFKIFGTPEQIKTIAWAVGKADAHIQYLKSIHPNDQKVKRKAAIKRIAPTLTQFKSLDSKCCHCEASLLLRQAQELLAKSEQYLVVHNHKLKIFAAAKIKRYRELVAQGDKVMSYLRCNNGYATDVKCPAI